MVAATRERINVAALPKADLCQDVRGSSEAEKADALAVACLPERTPANQSGTQKRRERYGIGTPIESECECRIGHDMRRETAVTGIAGKLRPVA